MRTSSTRACTVCSVGGRLGMTDPEDQIAGQQVPEFVADDGGVDFAAVGRLAQDLLNQRLTLIEELILHRFVECGVARHLDQDGADGAGLFAGVLADDVSQPQ